MSCTDPRDAWQLRPGVKPRFTRPVDAYRFTALKLPCGQCLSCRISHSVEWGIRAWHEMLYHKQNTAFALTYDNDHLPPGRALWHKDFQDFMKRVRDRFQEVEIRFLMSGEYGTKHKRPHYHVILFGLDFSDKVMVARTITGFPLYQSAVLDKLWGKGGVRINDANQAVAEYLAKYTAKRSCDVGSEIDYRRVDVETGETWEVSPEYIRASNGGGKSATQGGLGFRYAMEHLDQIYAFDNVVINKRELRVPRYYDKLLKRVAPERLDQVKALRKERAELHPEEQTPARLHVKSLVRELKYKHRHRGKFSEVA